MSTNSSESPKSTGDGSQSQKAIEAKLSKSKRYRLFTVVSTIILVVVFLFIIASMLFPEFTLLEDSLTRYLLYSSVVIAVCLLIFMYLQGVLTFQVHLVLDNSEDMDRIVLSQSEFEKYISRYVDKKVSGSYVDLHNSLSKLYLIYSDQANKDMLSIMNRFIDSYNKSRLTRRDLERFMDINEVKYKDILDNVKKDQATQVELIQSLLSDGKFTLNDRYSTRLLEQLRGVVDDNITETFMRSLEDRYSYVIASKSYYDRVLRDLHSLKDRLLSGIHGVERRANINLAAGSGITISALIYLFFSIKTYDIYPNNVTEALMLYLPKISLVIAAELFALFFLKLYRSNILDVKYYQNELTNIELKMISLQTAYSKSDIESMRKIMIELSKTERNFKLNKGETTVSLEKNKLDAKNEYQISRIIKSILRRMNK